MKKTFLAILFLMTATCGFSQFTVRTGNGRAVRVAKNTAIDQKYLDFAKGTTVYAQIDGTDTLIIVDLPELDVDLMSRYFEITETRQGRRLVNNVRTVYPYAKLAKDKLLECDTILASTESEAERRRLMKEAEDEITEKYTEELENLNFSQGLILIRLIDRETGNTSYKLVQELRCNVRAFFYQGFARLWGYNLKTEFDPKNNKEDEQIDIIATLLERGQI